MSASGSLRARLLLVGVAGIVLVALLAGWLLGEAFERAAGRAFDRALGNDLAAVAGLIEARPDGEVELRELPADSRYLKPLSGSYWQVGEGPAALRSRSLWDVSLALPAARDDGRRQWLQVTGPAGQTLRVLRQRLTVPRTRAGAVVWVAADDSALRAEVAGFRLLAASAVGLLAAALLAVLFVQVQLGLRPLGALSKALSRVHQGEQARLDANALPREVLPLANEFNALLEHHSRSIERARNAASDLAHALKTPLAVLDAAVQQRGHDAELAEVVRAQSARMQLVVRRQLASASVADFQARAAVAPIVAALSAMLGRLHQARGVVITYAIESDLEFRGSAADLEEILGNLIDNACKWAQRQVHIGAARDAAGLHLWVEDDGSGLSSDEAERALQRGVRLDQRVPGSGLGLAIVDDLTRAYGGTLQLARSPLGGLRAELRLPAAAHAI